MHVNDVATQHLPGPRHWLETSVNLGFAIPLTGGGGRGVLENKHSTDVQYPAPFPARLLEHAT